MDFNTNGKTFNLDILHREFTLSAIAPKYLGLKHIDGTLSVLTSALISSEEDIVANIVSQHFLNVGASFDFAFEATKQSQENNINFGRHLLHDWMRKNIIEGMTIRQSLWVFSRFENFPVICEFGVQDMDIFKMFYSGAIPTAYYCLLQVTPDPMTEPYHWLSQTRINWIIGQIEAYLGAGMVAYIKSISPAQP